MKPHILTDADKEAAKDYIYVQEILVCTSSHARSGNPKRLTYMVGPATYRVYDGSKPVGCTTLDAAIEAYNDLG